MKRIFRLFNRDNLLKILFVSYCLLPVLELDYLIYDVINQFGIPLPSTIVHYLWFPVLIVLTYFVMEKSKIKVFLLTGAAGAVYLGYFIVHHSVCKNLFDVLYLTNRFVYSLAHEFSYFATLIIPLFFIYCIVKLKPSQIWLDRVVIILCCLISIPIFLSNIFEVGLSTYTGTVQANFLTWFTGIYDVYHPRELCAKFYFPEGNTTGIMMFALYPLLIKVFVQSDKRMRLLPLVIIHGLAMFMLGTRVATYGAILSFVAVIAVCGFLFIFKKQRYNWKAISVLCAVCCMFTLMYPYTPSVVNQKMAEEIQFNIGSQIDVSKKDELNSGAVELIPGTVEYNYYYIHIFLDQELYKYFTFPAIYYSWIYPYDIDAKFWVDLAWEVPFEQRADGRDFERLFFDYKWKNLNDFEKLFGFSYSMFMNGSVNLEQDFIVQKYQYGYLGFVLVACPWFAVLGAIILKALLKLKESLNIDVLIMGISTCALYLAGYMSGHAFDEYLTSLFLALLLGMLINSIFKKEPVVEDKKND